MARFESVPDPATLPRPIGGLGGSAGVKLLPRALSEVGGGWMGNRTGTVQREAVRCTLESSREVKTEIPARVAGDVAEDYSHLATCRC